jgi:pimeloyl-ACP methyl ester carboxylesterase
MLFTFTEICVIFIPAKRINMTSSLVIRTGNANLACLISGAGSDIILFIHGSGMSARSWLPQLDAGELNSRYKLIAIDLPGHGHSTIINDDLTSLTPSGMANLLAPLLAEFGAKRFLMVGLSFGTNIIAEIPNPLSGGTGIMLVSPCIVNNDSPPTEVITAGPYGHVIVTPRPSEEDVRAYVNSHYVPPPIAEQYIRDFQAADPRFREQLAHFVVNAGWSDELANIQRWQVPICVVFGEKDTLLKTAYLDNFSPLWQGQTYKVKEAGHFVNEEQPETFNQLLLRYANDCFR